MSIYGEQGDTTHEILDEVRDEPGREGWVERHEDTVESVVPDMIKPPRGMIKPPRDMRPQLPVSQPSTCAQNAYAVESSSSACVRACRGAKSGQQRATGLQWRD